MHRMTKSLILIATLALSSPAWAQDPTDPNAHRPAPPSQPKKPATPTPGTKPAPRSTTATRTPDKKIRVAAFGEFGSTDFTASQSFNAVLGKTNMIVAGGGAQVALRNGLFVQVDITHASDTGQRVFVNNGQVFKLGLTETVEMTPIDVTAGYRFRFGRRRTLAFPTRPTAAERIVPYIGGGIGVVSYKETGQFAETGDDVNESFTSYNVTGGVEVRILKFLSPAVEFQQRWVPDGLGKSGASKAFNETDLGGTTIKLKIMICF
jgi:hypothetical protein